jgi:hypothetical protein
MAHIAVEPPKIRKSQSSSLMELLEHLLSENMFLFSLAQNYFEIAKALSY